MKKSFLLIGISLIFSCAVQQYPTGGPVDSESPELESSSISSGTTNFSDDEITFQFSEYMDKNSVQNALFISPSVENKYELKWSGKEMKLHFLTELRKNVTYVVTIGTVAGDKNAGNKLSQSYQLSFSTGDEIDSTEIKGLVVDAKTFKPFLGSTVLAYRLSENKNPNPANDAADYVTQSGADGKFKLSFLKEDNYRLFAIDDQFKNENWDSLTEAIAVGEIYSIPSKKVADSSYTFFLTKIDKTPPSVTGIVAESADLLKITFSEAINWNNSKPELLLQNEKEFTKIIQWEKSVTNADQIFVFIDSLKDGGYKFIQKGLSDNEFNLSVADTTAFSYLKEDKKQKVTVQIFPQDSTKTLLPSENISLVFRNTVPVDSIKFFEKPLKKGIKWIPVKGVEFPTSNSHFQTLTKSGGWNQEVQIKGYLFRQKDTISVAFSTYSPNETGSIAGFIENYIPNSETVVDLYEIPVSQSKKQMKSKTDKFSVKEIPSGKYIVQGFSDLNGNQKWDAGEILPWKPSEPRYYVQDTIKVRARWTVEDLKLKKW